MGNFATSWLRTTVPAVWGSVVAAGVSYGLVPDDLVVQAEGFGAVLVAVSIALYYAGARWVEGQDWSPDWLASLLLGSKNAPQYAHDDNPPVRLTHETDLEPRGHHQLAEQEGGPPNERYPDPPHRPHHLDP